MDFPKTHNIAALLVLISETDEALAADLMPARALSRFAVESRYPGDIPELIPDDAPAALKLSKNVRDAVRATLGEFE